MNRLGLIRVLLRVAKQSPDPEGHLLQLVLSQGRTIEDSGGKQLIRTIVNGQSFDWDVSRSVASHDLAIIAEEALSLLERGETEPSTTMIARFN